MEKYRVVWLETHVCSKVLYAESESEAIERCHDCDDPDTREFEGCSDWSVIPEKELNPVTYVLHEETQANYSSDMTRKEYSERFRKKEDCLNRAMLRLFEELGDGDGENGGEGSLWRCAKEIYDCLASGGHYCYADMEWWIEEEV